MYFLSCRSCADFPHLDGCGRFSGDSPWGGLRWHCLVWSRRHWILGCQSLNDPPVPAGMHVCWVKFQQDIYIYGWSQSEIYTRLTLRPNNAACGLTAGKCKWLHPWWLRRCDRGGHITPRARQQFEVVPTPESKWLDLSRIDDLAAEFIEFLWEVREQFFRSNFIFCR